MRNGCHTGYWLPKTPCLGIIWAGTVDTPAIHPPSQEATAVKRWRNAKRVPADLSAEALAKAETLAKEGCFGGFRRSPNRRHGCEAVGLHYEHL